MVSKAQVKYIHALQHKKYRQKFGRFIAEGAKVVEELLGASGGVKIQELYAVESWLSGIPEQLRAALPAGIIPVTPEELARLTALESSRQVLAVCDIPLPGGTDPSGKRSLGLEEIRDPGNLGTIIRIADWFGIAQVFCSPGCADVYNPKTIQATMGSIARVRVTETDISALLEQYPALPVYAATLQGQPWSGGAIREGMLLIGNESRGLSEKLVRRATCQVTIPRLGQAESLNAAVAAGILCSRMLQDNDN
ncbi:RNA methyltransferase [Compostibacter hankyongensis]|uniref:RNA methyltransferase n=1 Tax=Compostibacter hankyongensis TaxID=1007089 RepID=A0ABP8FXS3_9BACT